MPAELVIFKSPDGEAKSEAAYEAALSRWPVPYEERDITTRLGATHVITSGAAEGKPLVLLHGQDSSATSWVYDIERLSREFKCHAVDTIGDIGKSRPTRLAASRKDWADWLLDVFEGLRIESADMAGLSYGGFLTANFALAHPERVHRMALLAPGIIPNLGRLTMQWARYGMPMFLMPSRSTIRRFISGASAKGYCEDDPVHEQMIVAMPQLKHAGFLPPTFTDEELCKLTTPTLLLIGDHEIMYEPRRALARAKELLPNVQTELVPGAGHMLNGDQPEMVDEKMVSFLKAE